jgi:hypothetical protein
MVNQEMLLVMLVLLTQEAVVEVAAKVRLLLVAMAAQV